MAQGYVRWFNEWSVDDTAFEQYSEILRTGWAIGAHFGGFSIGSNDPTRLTLGVDRDNGLITDACDEGDPGAPVMIRLAVEGPRRKRRRRGICEQGPSDCPGLAALLFRKGIESISQNRDSVSATIVRIAEAEKEVAT